MLKKVFSFLLFLSVSVAFAQDITSDTGRAMFGNDKYNIYAFISPYTDDLLKELSNKIPTVGIVNKVKLNQEVGIVLTVSPSSQIENANLSYSIALKLPNGEITPSSNHVLMTGKLHKGALYPIQGQIYTMKASDYGAYQFIIDIFDDEKKLKRLVMGFSVIE